jgi:beta-xylosidase
MLVKMKMQIFLFVLFFQMILISGGDLSDQKITNPLFNGFYAADPTIVKYEGSYFIYATIDPWGGNELAVFVTKDFVTWEQKHINWPTKQQCTSQTSNTNMVWAPSVVQAKNGKFYMYVSVGSEVWAGVSDHPLGPWKNIKGDNSPLIKSDYFPGFHMIDAECFIDTDNQVYLYWGSGLDWVNGHCFVVKLKPDMVTFDTEPKDVTPPNYFEAPLMFKNNGVYYLMYSEGKCSNATYKVRYSTGKTPFGPWTEGVTSPILSTSKDSTVLGPGHHTIFSVNEQNYILYHRIDPKKNDTLVRQICIDSLNFDKAENIKPIVPQGIYFK